MSVDYWHHDLYVLMVTGPVLKVLRQMRQELRALESSLARERHSQLWRTLKPFIYALPEAIAIGAVLLFIVLRSAMHRRADSIRMAATHGAPADAVKTGSTDTAFDGSAPGGRAGEQGLVEKLVAPGRVRVYSGRAGKPHWWRDPRFLRGAIGLTLVVVAEIIVLGIAYLVWYFKHWATTLDFIWRLGPAGGTALWTLYIITALVAVVTLLAWIEFLDRLDYQRRREEWVRSAHRYWFDGTLENQGP